MIYEILEADTAGDLQIKVNERLANGWELYGSLVAATISGTSEVRSGISFAVESRMVLFQTVVKNN